MSVLKKAAVWNVTGLEELNLNLDIVSGRTLDLLEMPRIDYEILSYQ